VKRETPNTGRNILIVREKHGGDPFDDGPALREEIERLRRENDRMRRSHEEHRFPAQSAKPATTYKTFYYIGETHYLDEPHWEPGDGVAVLRSNNPIRNFEDYLDQHPDIAFAIIKVYDSRPPSDRSKIERKDGAYRIPQPTSQVLSLVSKAMVEAIEEFVDRVPHFRELFPKFNPRKPLRAPYLFMFHSEPYLQEILPDLDPISCRLLIQLEKCIRKSHGFEHDSAKSLAKKGRVSNDLFGYLIRPGDVLVKRAGPRTEAYIAMDWAQESRDAEQVRKDDFRYDEWNARKGASTKGWDARKQEEIQTWYGWTVPVWSWVFDGNFEMRRRDLELGVEASYSGEIIPIDQLPIIPLQYAKPDVRDQLEKRGRMFWTLRYKRFVSYRQTTDGELNNVRSLP
jgi:hypothetical protein